MYYDAECEEFVPTAVGEPCTDCAEPVHEKLMETNKLFYVLYCPMCGLVSNIRLPEEPTYD